MWESVWRSGAAWVSPSTDYDVVLLIAETSDERAHLRPLVLAGGDWRDRVALRAVESQLVRLWGLLGFSPSDRARLGVGEVERVGVLSELRARQLARVPALVE